MKVALITDTHAGCNNSSEFMMDYQDRFYSHVFFPYLNDNNIKYIIHLGDYFDNRKALNIKAISENRKHFIQPMLDYGIEMDILVGNHDIYYKNTNKVNSLQEILGDHKEIEIFDEPVNISNAGICMVPWITPENREQTLKVIKASKAKICLGHFEFSGFKMNKNDPYGFRGEEQIDQKLFKKFDMVLSGHFHTKSKVGNIQYLGAPFQFTWADLNDPKYFHILDTETLELEAIENPLNIFKEFIYNDEVSDEGDFLIDKEWKNKIVRVIPNNVVNNELYENFINTIKGWAYQVTTRLPPKEEDIVAEFDTGDIMDTPNLMNQYVENLDTNLDKSKLGSMLNELYKEAQNI